MKQVVILPAHNESKHLGKVIAEVKNYCPTIIVVDDGSLDDTSKIAQESGAITLRHVINLGKGAALRTGCDYAIKEGFEELIVMDSDGQHDASLIPKFFETLQKTPLVLGSRDDFKERMPFFKRMGNFVINMTTTLLYGTSFRDSQSGYRAFTKEAYQKIKWKSRDYSMESEMLARALKTHTPFTEISIPTIYLEKYKGTSILDGLKIVVNLIKWRISL